jgi:outer membrane receptor protein involved in Fe transport
MVRTTARNLLLVSCATAAMISGVAASSPAEDRHVYNIEQQDLGSALRKFSQISGTDLIFPPELVQGKRTSGIEGAYTDEEVLKHLLAGTGLAAVKTGSGALVLRLSPQKISASVPEARPLVVAQAAPPEQQNAQAAPTEEIVVTGTRIIRNGYEAPTPVSVLGAEQLNAVAATNIADAVREMPVFSNAVSGRTSTGNLTSGAAGVNLLNLRGMGAQRTLVLLDGHRVINASLSSGFTGVDVNSMPNGLVSRVDVVTGGASAQYGSDALSGVVNFVTDKTFTGVKGTVEGGVTTYGDDRNYLVNLAVGLPFANDRGHFMIFGEDAYTQGIRGNTRPWNAQAGSVVNNPAYGTGAGQSTSVPQYLVAKQVGVINGTPGGIVTGGPLKGIYFGPGGIPLQFNYGLNTSSNTMVGGDWQMSRIDNGLDIDPELSRQNMFARLSYDITDNIDLWAEYQWANAHSNAASNPNRTLANVPVLSGNPFIPASVQAQMTALKLTSITIGSTNGDVPRFHSNNTRTLRRGAVGAEGKFDAFGTDWKWDFYYQLSAEGLAERSDNVGNFVAGTNIGRLNLAEDAVRGPNGQIMCRSTLTSPNNGCVPYNPMGIGVNTQAAINYAFGTSFRHDSLRQDATSANVTGEPFSLWAGPVSVALGVEHRYERVNSIETPEDDANTWLTGNYHLNLGNYSVTEGFVETVIPLAKDTSWAKSLELNGAVRATSYTTSGYVTTWKVGATWQVIDDIRFRGTRSRDIRAPYLGELFAGGTAGSGGTFIDRTSGTITTSGFSLSKGNPTLGPEQADTTGLGIVLSPTFFQGFQASVDYYNINIGNATEVPNAQSIIDGCQLQHNAALCPNIIYVAGQINTVITSPQNIAQQVQKGLDIEASYTLHLDDVVSSWQGEISLRALGTYVLELKSVDLQFGTVDGRGVLGGFAVSGFSGLTAPKFQSNVTLSYTLNPIAVSIIERHVSSGSYNNAMVACTSGCPLSTAAHPTIDNNHIDSNDLFDLSIRYKFIPDNRDTEAFLTISNLFNTAPPFIGGSVGSTYYGGQGNTQYDRLGRMFLAGVRFKM